MKKQCPGCKSYNEESSLYCDQCGSRLGAAREALAPARKSAVARSSFPVESAPPASRRWLFLLLGLALIGGGVAIYLQQIDRSPEGEGDSGSTRGEVEISSLVRLPPGGDSSSRAEVQSRSSEDEDSLEPLPLHRLRPRVQRAFTRLVLLDEFEAELPPLTGIFLGTEGVVLTRLHGLAGARRGQAFTWGRREPADIIGVIQVDAPRDLALLQIRPPGGNGPDGESSLFPGIGLIAQGELDDFAPVGTEVVVVTEAGREPRDWIRSHVEDLAHHLGDGVPRIELGPGSDLGSPFSVVVDNYGYLLGLGLPGEAGADLGTGGSLVIDTIGSLDQALVQPAGWTLGQYTDQYWEGTFAAYLHRGQRNAERKRHDQAVSHLFRALELAPLEGALPEEIEDARDLLRRSLVEQRGQLRRVRAWTDLARLLERSVEFFPDWREIWVELALARSKLQDHAGTILAAREARQLEDGEDVRSLLVRTYATLASQLLDRGDSNGAAQTLLEGIDQFPESGRLHLALARIYFSWDFLEDSERLFRQAARLDPTLSQEVELFLEKIDDVLSRKNMAIIPIRNASRITSEVVLDGAARYPFVIDTGASMSSITRSIAYQLGYDDSHLTRKVIVRGVNSQTRASLLKLGSISLQGFTVRDIDVIVLEDGAPTLLGLNFLNHFRYTVDARKGEFRLEGR